MPKIKKFTGDPANAALQMARALIDEIDGPKDAAQYIFVYGQVLNILIQYTATMAEMKPEQIDEIYARMAKDCRESLSRSRKVIKKLKDPSVRAKLEALMKEEQSEDDADRDDDDDGDISPDKIRFKPAERKIH